MYLGKVVILKICLSVSNEPFWLRQKGSVQNKILLSGPPGTGKNRSVGVLVNELFKKKLIPYKSVSTLDLSQYGEKEIQTNFIVDCSALFSYGIGTVCFTGFEKANSQVLHYITKLFEDGYFRTPEGIVVNASDYFLILYMDAEVREKEVDRQIPPSIANKVPTSLLREIQSFAYTEPLTLEVLENILQEKLQIAGTKLKDSAQLTIHFEKNLITQLAIRILSTNRYGEAIDDFVEDHFTSLLLDARARNEVKAFTEVQISMKDNDLVASTGNDTILLKTIPMVKEESLDDILAELNALIGLNSVKSFIHELLQTVNLQKQRAQRGGKVTPMTLHMVFTGNPGTGKTTVARMISRVLKAMGLLSHGQLVEVARQDLVGQYVGSTAIKTNSVLERAIGGVLFVDEAYTLARNKHDSFGLEAIDTLVKGMEDHRENLVVIMAGYTEEMETFLKSNPGLRSRFPFIVEFPDYLPEDMLDIMLLTAKQREYTVEQEAYQGLLDLFERKQIPGRNDSGNGRLVRNLFEEAVRKQSVRINESEEYSENMKLNELVGSDFGIGIREEFDLETTFKDIIGLENVKNFIFTLEKQILANKRRQEAGIQTSTEQTLNFIFSGNPGTGKTTIARLLASMLKSMGILKRGHLVEVDRSHLVAEYSGQTAIKTTEVVKSALGGVLFIDEAYSLVEEGTVGGGFGKEAIDTLVRLIENHRENLVVVLAGYTEDMERFLKSNPGLSSRFPLQIEFPDYNPEQLAQMTGIIAKSKGFVIAEDVTTALVDFYETKQIPGRNDSGNGRLVQKYIGGSHS